MTKEKFMLPDRYEALEKCVSEEEKLKIISMVDDGIEKINELYEEITSTGRGAFLILRGKSGSGKTTFLKTLNLFIEDIEIITIENNVDIVQAINGLEESRAGLRVAIIEGRESILDSKNSDITNSIHSINRFIRSEKGNNTLIVWPCNNDDIIRVLVDTSKTVGGSSLLGLDDTYFEFSGPEKGQFVKIAKQTIEMLNGGKTLIDFGIDDEVAHDLVEKADTIGMYLKIINREIRKNKKFVSQLAIKERCKMWIIVLAGNEPSKDVEALTKGELLDADIQRLMVSTDSNIVTDLKKYPKEIGLLANYLDCKIIYVPIVTTLKIVRNYASDKLVDIMKHNNMSVKKDNNIQETVNNTELVKMINSDIKDKGRKGKTGSNSVNAFGKLLEIAKSNDRILNETFGRALKECGIIDEYDTEQDFGHGLTRRTDLLFKIGNENYRLEFMWRKSTGKAEIANYTLTKLYNYARALEFIK